MLKLDALRKDTICALATAPLKSAIALIRVSGPDAHTIQRRVFKPKRGQQKPFVATLGDVLGIDEALCTEFPEGKSYTGEPSFELSLHGSPVVVKSVLQALQDSGCRPAAPGEFSMRAVLSGKIDLCQAEAVCDLISAQSDEAAKVALKNLKGGLERFLAPVRHALIDALCETEARLDFPDEGLGEKPKERLLASLDQAAQTLQKLLAGAQFGTRLTQGARLVIFGRPNAGKSTLLNTLIGENKAIVHHLPGTTRDAIEATWQVKGIPISLVDVAGVRESENLDPVEAIGIERARQELERADAVLWLCDATETAGFNEEFLNLQLKSLTIPVIRVRTKADLLRDTGPQTRDALLVSSHTQSGLEALHDRVFELLVREVASPEEVLLTRARQKDEVEQALASLQVARHALALGEPDEVIASELRGSAHALDRLLGKSLNEDVLDLIFSRFCIGK